MGNALNRMFAFLTSLFSALEKVAKSCENIATVGEEKSQAFLDEARTERQAKLIELNKQLKIAAKP